MFLLVVVVVAIVVDVVVVVIVVAVVRFANEFVTPTAATTVFRHTRSRVWE